MSGRRRELHTALAAIQRYERGLAGRLLAGMRALPGATIYGLVEEEDLPRRVPTVALTIAGHTPRELAEALGRRGIFCWDGNYYALTLMERLGLEPTRVGGRRGRADQHQPADVERVALLLGA